MISLALFAFSFNSLGNLVIFSTISFIISFELLTFDDEFKNSLADLILSQRLKLGNIVKEILGTQYHIQPILTIQVSHLIFRELLT